jgi:SAP domain
LKIKELKELLRGQRLPVSGSKEVLVKRLIAASAKQSLGDNEVEQKEQELEN